VNKDQRLLKWLVLLIAMPVMLAFFGGDRFRYPCQDPENWGTADCQRPICEVHRQCPEHIFKGNDDLIKAANQGAPQQ